jgi:heme oxygenase (mycobilin-producing)
VIVRNIRIKGGKRAMIKVLLERRVKKTDLARLVAHLTDLRAAALRQPGYVTGETLIKGDGLTDVLVISTWVSEDHWKAWTTSQERIEIEDVINSMIDGETRISIYSVTGY